MLKKFDKGPSEATCMLTWPRGVNLLLKSGQSRTMAKASASSNEFGGYLESKKK